MIRGSATVQGADVRRGDVRWVSLEPTLGAEIRGKPSRPCVVLTTNVLNERRRTVVVAPLTHSGPANPPLTVGVTTTGEPSFAAVEHIRSVDKRRLGERIAILSEHDMAAVEDALREILEV